MMEEKIILNDKRKISLQRAKELKECARPFVNYKKKENMSDVLMCLFK